MSIKFNPIPTASEEELKRMERLKEDLTSLKEHAYGPDSNSYEFCESGRLPKKPLGMSIKELEMEIVKVLPGDVVEAIAKDQRKLRSEIDSCLAKTVVEEILPIVMPPTTLVEYDFYVVGRNLEEIDSKVDPHRGREDIQHHIEVLPVGEWKDEWKEHIFLDERASTEEIERYLPRGTNCLVSTVHKLYAVKRNADKKKNGKNNNTNGFLPGYTADDSKLEIDFRTKSGIELMWKYAQYLTGLERSPGKKREDIVDLAGFRPVYLNGFEEESLSLYQEFMDRVIGSCKGSLILQLLDLGVNRQKAEFEQKIEFLKNLKTRQLRKLCEEILIVEDRSSLLPLEDVKGLGKKYYVEMLIPICAASNNNNFFGRNVINGLAYPLQTLKKILEKTDHFIYDGRAEDWRNEHYTALEWLLIRKLAPALLIGSDLKYMERVYQPRLERISRRYR